MTSGTQSKWAIQHIMSQTFNHNGSNNTWWEWHTTNEYMTSVARSWRIHDKWDTQSQWVTQHDKWQTKSQWATQNMWRVGQRLTVIMSHATHDEWITDTMCCEMSWQAWHAITMNPIMQMTLILCHNANYTTRHPTLTHHKNELYTAKLELCMEVLSHVTSIDYESHQHIYPGHDGYSPATHTPPSLNLTKSIPHQTTL